MVILGTNRKGRSEVVLDDFKISKKFFEKLSTDVNWKPVFSDAVTINEQNEKVRVKLNLLDTIKLFLFSAYYTVPMANDMVLYHIQRLIAIWPSPIDMKMVFVILIV